MLKSLRTSTRQLAELVAWCPPFNAVSNAPIDFCLVITLFIMSEMQSPGNNTTSSTNCQSNCQFTSEQRSAIVAEVSSGKSYAQVAKDFNTTKSTVFAIPKRWRTTQSVDPKPCGGRPQKLTTPDCRYVLLQLKRDPNVTWDDLVHQVGGHASCSTLRRIVEQHWGREWRASRQISAPKQDARHQARPGLRLGGSRSRTGRYRTPLAISPL